MTIRGPTRDDDTQVLKVERPFYQQQQFNSELSYCKPDATSTCSAWLNNIKPLKFITSIFPIFTWMSQYNIRNDLVCDLISGCTVAVMHIPQGNCICLSCGLPVTHRSSCIVISHVITMIYLGIVRFQLIVFDRYGICNVSECATNRRYLYGILSGVSVFFLRHIQTQFNGYICCNQYYGR